jgi:hypothetical protein
MPAENSKREILSLLWLNANNKVENWQVQNRRLNNLMRKKEQDEQEWKMLTPLDKNTERCTTIN